MLSKTHDYLHMVFGQRKTRKVFGVTKSFNKKKTICNENEKKKSV